MRHHREGEVALPTHGCLGPTHAHLPEWGPTVSWRVLMLDIPQPDFSGDPRKKPPLSPPLPRDSKSSSRNPLILNTGITHTDAQYHGGAARAAAN